MFKNLTLTIFVLALAVSPSVVYSYELTEFDRQSAFSNPYPSIFGAEQERQRQALAEQQANQRISQQLQNWKNDQSSQLAVTSKSRGL
jgi:hypothetical protein